MAIIYTYPVKTTPVGDDLILISDSTNNTTKQTKVSSLPFTNNAGTVTSVGLTMPAAFAVADSPVTGNGIIKVTGTGGSTGQFLAYPGTSWATPAGGPAGSNTEVQFNNNGVFGADPGLSIDVSTTRTRLDLGHRLNPTGRGEINIHSGARNQGFTQGGVLDLEYAYPTNAPTVPGNPNTAAYAFVGLIGPKYDDTLELSEQGYNIQLPVVTPNDNTQTNYTDSRVLVVNGTTTGTDPVHESKWISTSLIGGGGTPGGSSTSVQFKNAAGNFDGNSDLTYDGNGSLRVGSIGGEQGVVTIVGTDGDSGILKIGHINENYKLSLGLGNDTMAADYSIDFPVAAPGANNKILESNSSGTLSWIDTPTGFNLTVQDDTSPSYSNIDTINFIGGGVSVGNTTSNIADITVVRRNNGFSPFPIYQGNGTITIAAGNSLAIAAQTICDIQAGQMTITRVFGDLPEECIINVAVYTGSLTFQGGTSLAYFASKTLDATDATNQIHAVTAAVGTSNNWVPAAGSSISIIIEIDNSSGTTDAVLLGSATASNFSNTLAFEVQPPQGSTSIFNPTATNPNTTLGKQVNTILNYSARSATAKRVCNHYDPF